MPGVVAFPARESVVFCVLEMAKPGAPKIAIGIFRWEPTADYLAFRLRPNWEELHLSEEDLEYCSFLEEDFTLRIREMGGQTFLQSLEDSLSNFLVLSLREPAAGRSLEDLYEEYVDARVQPYQTHLPIYSLQAAATKFGGDSEVSAVGWRRVEGLRLAEGMFVARVVGRSMEPLIPDGSFCVFRAPVVGSRQGKRLLIEQLGVTDSSACYTVKRYTSQKRQWGEDEWEHSAIRLEPLNPEFPAFELDESQFRVIGEFVKVLS